MSETAAASVPAAPPDPFTAIPVLRSRMAAAGAAIPPASQRLAAEGLDFVADPFGTALVTADGRRWSPAGHATYEHWGAQGDGLADDTAAIRAAHDWCMRADVPLRPQARTYRVTGPIIDYDLERDGAGLRLNLVGEGPSRTVFHVDAGLSGFLIRISGSTRAYGAPHAKFWNIEDLQIRSDGQVTADILRIDCAGQCDFDNVLIYNCRGHALCAREWWDSLCNITVTRCGDDGLGPNSGGDGQVPVAAFCKEAVRFDWFFASHIANSACNNIFMPKSFQIEAARDVAMYWGPGTRKCTLNGKLHGTPHDGPPGRVPVPHLVLDGARQNYIIGANMAEADAEGIAIVNRRNWIPVENVIAGCSVHADGEAAIVIEGGRRNVVTGNTCCNPAAGVKVTGGLDNIVHSNPNSARGAEVLASGAGAVKRFRYPGEVECAAPGGAFVLRAPNGVENRLTVSNTGVLLLNGVPV